MKYKEKEVYIGTYENFRGRFFRKKTMSPKIFDCYYYNYTSYYLYLWLYPTQTPLFNSGPDSLSDRPTWTWQMQEIYLFIVGQRPAHEPSYAPPATRQLIN